jgi:glycosyltransferase involved in cell wall biosynthesis
MKKRLCVDVVIPVFNGQDTIRAALESVLAQRGSCVEKVIVIDDGSTDGTADIVERIGSTFIQLVRTSNRGVAAARNLGIEYSTADWVAFLDADDLWKPEKLQAQLAAAIKYDVGFVCCAAGRQSVRKSGVFSAITIARGNFMATSSVLLRRDVLGMVSPLFQTDMSFAEDYLAWLKCLTITRGYYISIQLVDYIWSDRPRYRWENILRNLVYLNWRYIRFIYKLDMSLALRFILCSAVFFGSIRSLISIFGRFVGLYNWRIQARSATRFKD